MKYNKEIFLHENGLGIVRFYLNSNIIIDFITNELQWKLYDIFFIYGIFIFFSLLSMHIYA